MGRAGHLAIWAGVGGRRRPHTQMTARSRTHAAITENKRLGDMLTFIKTQQDTDPPQVGPVGKQRTRYTPTGKPSRGKKGWVERRAERRAAEAQAVAPPPAE